MQARFKMPQKWVRCSVSPVQSYPLSSANLPECKSKSFKKGPAIFSNRRFGAGFFSLIANFFTNFCVTFMSFDLIDHHLNNEALRKPGYTPYLGTRAKTGNLHA